MNGFWSLILILAFIGVGILLCLFLCIMASISDDYWDEIKLKMEKRNGRK